MATSSDGVQLSIAVIAQVKPPTGWVAMALSNTFRHSPSKKIASFDCRGYTSSCTLSDALGAARLVHSHLPLWGGIHATEDLLSCVHCCHVRVWLQFSFGPGGRT